MGRDKAFIKISGKALIDRQLRLLEGVFKNCYMKAGERRSECS